MAVDPNAQRRARVRRRGIVLAVAVSAAVAVVAWLTTRPPVVDAVEPQRGPLMRTLQFTARVETPARVDIGPTLTGRVARVAVREGDRFERDAVLLQLEDEELRAAVTQADAEEMARRLAREEGLFGGISAAGALWVALQIAARVERATIVFVVCDRGDRYLSTGVFPA